MSDISISAMTMSSMALENQMSGAESIKDTSSTVISGVNEQGADPNDMAVAGAEVASRGSEFFGNGTDLSSTGTDIDTAQAINTSLHQGNGTIADKVV